MTTQGNAQFNQNNHPFLGQIDGSSFALAHNGVLWNDKELRMEETLPLTSVETDSYVAVQLLEQQKTLDFDSLQAMAEKVEGSFVFTVLDKDNSIWFVIGDNPLCIMFYDGFLIYASTQEILCKTIKKHGCKLIIDAQGELLQEALGCEPDFVKPNIFELAEAVGDKPSADPEVVVHSARKMLDMGAKAVCVSMGQEGALLTAKNEPESLYVTTTPKIYDEGAVGTGDAMVGAIANAMHAGMKFDEVARYAVAMGRACARLAGTEMASLKKVYEVYETTQVYVL